VVLPTLEELGIGFVPFSPLGKGFLTGKSIQIRSSIVRIFATPSPVLPQRIAKRTRSWLICSLHSRNKRTRTAQVVLAWLLAKRPWIVPIPGTTNLHRLEENLGAAHVELTTADLRAVENASSNMKLEGARYPEFHEQITGRRAPGEQKGPADEEVSKHPDEAAGSLPWPKPE
jgi:aryl-alcohol dehydrogenase-like predicted oxidoreductase